MDTDYTHLFPVTEKYAYLNHAACSPLCRPAVEAVGAYWRDESMQGTLSEARYFPVANTAREKVARLMCADHEEVAWVQNTSSALNLVANGLRWREGDNVVTVHGQFPSNVYPWLGLKRLGVETRLVPLQAGRVPLESIAAAIDARTRLLAVSWVEFGTGFRHDIYALGELCDRRGVLLAVDAIQGLGVLPLDVHRAGIHFLGAGTHKMLLGPQGLGILYVRRDSLDLLWPLSASWRSVPDKDDYLNYEQKWIDTAWRFEGSTNSTSLIVAFDAVLDMLHEVGPTVIEARVMALMAHLADGLLSRGYEVVSPLEPEARSSVLCFRAKGDPMDLLARAEAASVVISVRLGLVRVSPHFYNTTGDIDRLLALL